MKTKILSILFFAATILCTAQSIERDVVASSGDYFEGTNISLSWTLGEIATETYSSGNIILTQGFQQTLGIVIHGIDLDVFLEEMQWSRKKIDRIIESDGFKAKQDQRKMASAGLAAMSERNRGG